MLRSFFAKSIDLGQFRRCQVHDWMMGVRAFVVAQRAASAQPAGHGYRSDLLVATDSKSKNGGYLIG
jgi:hypothetical protein